MEHFPRRRSTSSNCAVPLKMLTNSLKGCLTFLCALQAQVTSGRTKYHVSRFSASLPWKTKPPYCRDGFVEWLFYTWTRWPRFPLVGGNVRKILEYRWIVRRRAFSNNFVVTTFRRLHHTLANALPSRKFCTYSFECQYFWSTMCQTVFPVFFASKRIRWIRLISADAAWLRKKLSRYRQRFLLFSLQQRTWKVDRSHQKLSQEVILWALMEPANWTALPKKVALFGVTVVTLKLVVDRDIAGSLTGFPYFNRWKTITWSPLK